MTAWSAARDARRERLRGALGRREGLRALVVAGLRRRVLVAGATQLDLVVRLERRAELRLEFAVARRALRLAFELAESRRQLADQDADMAEVVACLRQPPLGAGQLDAVAVYVRCFLDEPATLQRPQAEHLVDEALRHHGVGVLADLRAPKQILHVQQAHLLAVDAVLVLAAAVGAPADAHLVEVDRHPLLGVVERSASLRPCPAGCGCRSRRR